MNERDKSIVRRAVLSTIRALVDELKLKPMSERLTMFAQRAQATADNFEQMAALIVAAEENGEDLSQYDTPILPLLRRIGYGQMLPQLLVEYRGKPSLLRKVESLPLVDQERLAGNEPIPVAELGGDSWLCSPGSMTQAVASQVFAKDHIRTVEEQVVWLRGKESSRPPLALQSHPWTISRNAVIVNRPVRLTKRDIMNILKAMEG
jgi:hypothetical protein